MAGVKDRARQIVEEATAKAEEAVRAGQDKATRRARERQQRAAYVMEHSPLNEWFPDATFDIVDYTGVGTSLQYQSDGSDLIVQSDDGVLFSLEMNFRDAGFSTPACQVRVVRLVHASTPYAHEGPYYSGSTVESAEDVARVLKAWGAL